MTCSCRAVTCSHSRTLGGSLLLAGLLLGSVHATEQDPCQLPAPFNEVEHEWEAARKAAAEHDPDAMYRVGLAIWQSVTCRLDDRVPGDSIYRPGAYEEEYESGILGLLDPSAPWAFSATIPTAPHALRWLAQAAGSGHERAKAVLRAVYTKAHRADALTHLATPEVREIFRRAYETGSAQAQYDLGRWYRGLRTPRDGKPASRSSYAISSLAFFWYEQAAQQDHADAQYALGTDLVGIGGEWPEATKQRGRTWIERAAEQGHPDAMRYLGNGLVHGFMGYAPNPGRGLELLRRSAREREYGDRLPVYHPALQLADLLAGNSEFASGRSPALLALRDTDEALQWYRFVGEQAKAVDDADLLATVGNSLSNEDGEYQNYREAMRWYRESALRGYVPAQILVGDWYAIGRGVPKDEVAMYAWWSVAVTTAQAPDFEYLPRSDIEDQLPDFGSEMETWRREFSERLATLHSWLETAHLDLSRHEIAEGQRMARTLFAAIAAAESGEPPATIGQRGSGVLAGHGDYVVTNHHVVEDCPSIDVVRGEERSSAVVAASDPSDDLTLLRLSPPLPGPAPAFRHPVRASLGESVLVAGFPFTGSVEDGFTVTLGNVSALTGPQGEAGVFQLTAPVQQGNSGGPVLGPNGALLGVVVAKLDAIGAAQATGDLPQNVNYAVHAAVVRALLDLNTVPYQIRRKGRPQPDSTRAEEARTFTVAVVCRPRGQ